MKVCTLTWVCLFLAVGYGFGQSTKELKVQAAVEELRKAMVDADVLQLQKLTSKNLSYGHSGGNVQTKSQFIEALKTGSSDFVTIELSSQTIQVTGNTAIVRHVLSGTTNDNGKPGTVKLAVLLVWIKRYGAWKLLARQAVKVL